MLALYRTPLITIAALHGAAIGGGAGLVACCDLVVATQDAKIGFPETQRGLVPAQVAALLKRQCPMHSVRELLLVGALVHADRAAALGLVNQVVSFADLPAAVHHLAHEILKGGPQALKSTKRLLDALDPRSLEHDLDLCMQFSREAISSLEAEEGLRAFQEKREPRWQ